MGNGLEEERKRAIQRYRDGENPVTICKSMGRLRQWLYKWLQRWRQQREDWFRDRSRRPRSSPTAYGPEMKTLISVVRQSLAIKDLFCGAQAIRWELEDLAVSPVPSIRTISRILADAQLTRRPSRQRHCRGRAYPNPVAERPGDVHQTDFVGPCFLKGPLRFYSLNSVDLATGRCAVQPLLRRTSQPTVDGLWASWSRLGLPRHQQVDNELVFYGSPVHPRGMGPLIRLCLLYGIQVWFIPPGEPWRNGVVEKFNDHWRQKLHRRIEMLSQEDLIRESLRFEQRHNSRYRYSKLAGKTPLAALQASGMALRFPPTPQPPRCPLPKPESGCYHLIRFVRSDGFVNVFGEKFKAPPEATYEYVRATIDVQRQRLVLYLGSTRVDEHDYRLR